MLAIIAYKNLFPRDFADLQLNQGFVYTLFNNKELLIEEVVKSLSERISETIHQIELAKSEQLKTIKELDAAFEDKKTIDRWGKKQNLSTTDKQDYAERRQAIENRLNNRIPDLEEEHDYMTYFYENSLSRIDKTFLRSVTDRETNEYTYQLKNPQMVVSRLRLVDFDQDEILNFSLLTYLLHTQTHIEYLGRFIEQLKETKNFKFIGAYFDVTAEMPTHIRYLNIRKEGYYKIVRTKPAKPLAQELL